MAENLERAGLAPLCVSVRASELPVLALEADPEAANAKISEEIVRAIDEDGAEAIVLGCAGMADFAASLSVRHGVPVIEGVASAVKLMEAAVTMGLKTAKRGGYAMPGPKHQGFVYPEGMIVHPEPLPDAEPAE